MNEAWHSLWTNTEKEHSRKEILYEIDQTIAELETYLESNPDDEIAQIQYEQFLNKRVGFTLLLTEAYAKLSQAEIQA